MTTSSLEAARRVKSKARDVAARYVGVAGVGLTRIAGQYVVKVNLVSMSPTPLPDQLDGVRVIYEVTGLARSRPATGT